MFLLDKIMDKTLELGKLNFFNYVYPLLVISNILAIRLFLLAFCFFYFLCYNAKKGAKMKIEDLIKLSPAELTDMGICPTCLNRQTNGAIFGDDAPQRLFEDEDIDCMLITNPRAEGHMIISTINHYHDMSEAPDEINEKIIRFSKEFMKILCRVYGCERVYLCTMCDGPNNHYHMQLIPRYSFEKRGSNNFVKPRQKYIEDKEKIEKIRNLIAEFAQKYKEQRKV